MHKTRSEDASAVMLRSSPERNQPSADHAKNLGTRKLKGRVLSYADATGQGWFSLEIGSRWCFQVIRIYNSEVDIPTAANNVQARLEYGHADGERFIVDEALWLAVPHLVEFPAKVQIASAKTGLLCLMAQQTEQNVNGPFTVIADVSKRSSNKALKAGRWNVRISVSSDNFQPLVGAGGFILYEDHRLEYNQPRAFIFETDL